MSAPAREISNTELAGEIRHLASRVDGLHTKVDEAIELARATNGRLRKVELWKARIEAVVAVLGKVPIALSVLASVAAIASLVVILAQ